MGNLFWFQLIKIVTTYCLCKAHYYNCILSELGINTTFGNSTYTPTALSKDEILQNHKFKRTVPLHMPEMV
jgi:hypothetical protein